MAETNRDLGPDVSDRVTVCVLDSYYGGDGNGKEFHRIAHFDDHDEALFKVWIAFEFFREALQRHRFLVLLPLPTEACTLAHSLSIVGGDAHKS